MGLFGSSILFGKKDFDIYVFGFVGSPSFVMAKSIYGLRFDSLGKYRGWWVATTK
jgi:hypothetical protein